ncbi:dienelactone hydrolase family protein [Cyanobacterium stanieri LEGE 03274]|uniref:Dienelactone hydrolase family protein n=1 Tax=Cyanobacterium stanieri LEGE 03274 TaxID=1828756 RepID=A0ABR9V0B8_9CHRO|nr:dienelactone hydrolase family protein [Cyanobacterium stanieri]MBE9221325.1 dienelactone hydrolase family protein [Cyanobacterium stanieri LEGE 03274]
MNITTKSVILNGENIRIPAFLATPTDGGIYPGVVVVQEIFGVNEHIRDVTSRIAKEGYVAIRRSLPLRDRRSSYNKNVAQQAWQETLKLFESKL